MVGHDPRQALQDVADIDGPERRRGIFLQEFRDLMLKVLAHVKPLVAELINHLRDSFGIAARESGDYGPHTPARGRREYPRHAEIDEADHIAVRQRHQQ